MTGQPLTTYLGVVHPWMCDIMGHVNVRHYAAMFDDAGFQLMGHITGPDAPPAIGWADVRSTIEYQREITAGTLVTIQSRFLKIGRSSITFEQILLGTRDLAVRATNQTTSVRFHLLDRKSVPLEAAMRARAEEMLRSMI